MARGVSRAVLVVAVVVVTAVGWAARAPVTSPAAAASWSWPVAGAVTRSFAPPEHRWGAGHRGVDLLSAPGVPVRAAGAGRVSYAGLLAGRGVLVVVHGALRTTYEPVSATVGLGAVVEQGEVIGTLDAGHAGCPVLACLHWGLRRGEDYLDPLRLVEPTPVRLLPTGGTGPVGRRVAGDLWQDGGSPARPGGARLGVPPPPADRTAGTRPSLAEGRAAVPAAAGPDEGPVAAAGARAATGGAGAAHAAAVTALGAGAVLAGAALRRRS